MSGSGTGSFSVTGTYQASDNGIRGLAAGDFYGSGQVDLAMGSMTGDISILPGSTAGTWGTEVLYHANVAGTQPFGSWGWKRLTPS